MAIPSARLTAKIMGNELLKLSSEQHRAPPTYKIGRINKHILPQYREHPPSYDEGEIKLVKLASSTKLTSWNA